ncbi:MAG: hypothetical protein IJX17_06760 [Clostridia bacterium]|nr:hypothetical protein [Clostridia bacterium]
MEKFVFYKIYYFEDKGTGQKYYFEDKSDCNMARFIAYKRYDGERISRRNYVVPVTQVKSALVDENTLKKLKVNKHLSQNEGVYEPQPE